MPHDLVILGAGFAGIPLAHSMLLNTPSSARLTVSLVSPNTHFYWHNTSPRAIVPDHKKQARNSRIFRTIANGFAKYPFSRFRHICAEATSIDPRRKTVTLSKRGPDGGRTLHYDTLVIATGSRSPGRWPFKSLRTTAETKARIAEIRAKVKRARHMVVAGGGETGVETAGELGFYALHAASGPKTAVLICGGPLPLADHNLPALRQKIREQLRRLKVEIITSSRVNRTQTLPNGKTRLTIQHTPSGRTRTLDTDLYIPTFGVKPNTEFLPRSFLDAEKRIRTRLTLQVVGHDDIFALGDASNLQTPTGKHADAQTRALGPILRDRIVNGETYLSQYRPDDTIITEVSVGPGFGSGQIGRQLLSSDYVWYNKSYKFMMEVVGPLIKGERYITGGPIKKRRRRSGLRGLLDRVMGK